MKLNSPHYLRNHKLRLRPLLCLLSLLCLFPPTTFALYAQDIVLASQTGGSSSTPPTATSAASTPAADGTAVVLVGHVLGPDGITLSGATAQVVGSREVVVTRSEGEFMIKAQFGQGPVRIRCSYAGYDDKVLTLTIPPAFPLIVEMIKIVKQPLPVTGQMRDL